ncbi:MAG: TonB-dependent receptor, partial [Candidatus Aminicenantes bacterium]|nr:TonB-dependent receptor [Candidatus Aminicenantes bacterium]
YDLNAKANFNLSPKDKVFLSLYHGKDNLDNSRTQEMPTPRFAQSGASISFKSDISDLRKWGNTGIAALNWIRQWNDFFNIQDRASRIQINRTNPETGEVTEINRETGIVEKNNLYDFSARCENEIILGKKHYLGFGLQASSIRIKYDYETSDVNLGPTPRGWFGNISTQSMRLQPILDRDDRGNVFEAYLQDRWMPFPQLTITPGLRISYFNLTKETYYDPRLSLSLNIFGPVRLKAAWGRYHQFVSRVTREDVLQGNREFWALAGTTNVPVASVIHHIFGLSFENTSFLIDLEGYYKKLRGLSELAIRFRTPGEGRNYNQFIYNGTGTAKGLETLIQKKYGSYTGWVSYTLSRVEYLFPD